MANKLKRVTDSIEMRADSKVVRTQVAANCPADDDARRLRGAHEQADNPAHRPWDVIAVQLRHRSRMGRQCTKVFDG